jgi:hypothetical protein
VVLAFRTKPVLNVGFSIFANLASAIIGVNDFDRDLTALIWLSH